VSAREDLDSPFQMVGGRAVTERLAARFYEVMEQYEPALAAVHRQTAAGGIDPTVKERFALFLVGWLGGPQEYMEKHGHPRLRMRHARVPVDETMRDAWLRCMSRAMDDVGVAGRVRIFLDQRFAEVANFLMNVPG
jgi:hemoglobin